MLKEFDLTESLPQHIGTLLLQLFIRYGGYSYRALKHCGTDYFGRLLHL